MGRGSIHITSAGDVYAAPEFNAGFLSNPADLPTLIWGYKKAREVIRRMTSFRSEICETHPPFPQGSPAACLDHYDPDVKDVVYSEQDDQILENFIRDNVGTTWHSMYPYLFTRR